MEQDMVHLRWNLKSPAGGFMVLTPFKNSFLLFWSGAGIRAGRDI